MTKVCLPYGKGEMAVELPGRCLGEVASPRNPPAGADAGKSIPDALENPIESMPVERLVGPGKRVAVIVDDISRNSPVRLVLPHLIERLGRGGVRAEDIRIVIALGTHRPMTASEIDEKIGPRMAKSFQIVNTPCDNEEEMVFAGVSSGGIPAWVNRAVMSADVRIGVGSITPHMDTGFSGGAKIILPGVCSARTVAAFHARQAELSGNQLGVEEASLRLELENFVSEKVGLDFIVNVVMDGRGEMVRCVAGNFLHAHRQGVRYAKEVYAVPVSKRYPLCISNAYPAQVDFWQASKAIAAGEMMTRDGGTMILLAHCMEGNKTHPAFAKYIGQSPDELIRLIESGKAQDLVACAIAVTISKIRQRIRIALVSTGLDDKTCGDMGFTYYRSLESAVEKELSALPHPGGSVGILTHGGVSLPVLE